MTISIFGITIQIGSKAGASPEERKLADYQWGMIESHLRSLDIDGRVAFAREFPAIFPELIAADDATAREYFK